VINQEVILASLHNDNTQYFLEKCAGAWEAEFLPITRNLTNEALPSACKQSDLDVTFD